MNAYDAELYSDLACHFHGGGIEDSYGDNDNDEEPFLDPYDFGCVCAKPCAKKPCQQRSKKR